MQITSGSTIRHTARIVKGKQQSFSGYSIANREDNYLLELEFRTKNETGTPANLCIKANPE